MSYYVRAFCKADTKPCVKEILDHINNLDFGFEASANLNEEELKSADWTEFELAYEEGKLPIIVVCNHLSDEDGLAKREIDEFVEEIGPPEPFDNKKKKVIEHLAETKYIIANQLPVSNMDDDGYDVNGEFLNYFVDNCKGMIHAGGEGFYDGTEIILKTQ